MKTATFFMALCAAAVNAAPQGWSSDFASATNAAVRESRPLVLVWSAGSSCAYCVRLGDAVARKKFTDWKDASGCLFCYVEGTATKDAKAAKAFAKEGNAYPFVSLYWPKATETKKQNFCGRLPAYVDDGNSSHAKQQDLDELAQMVIDKADALFSGWPTPDCGGFVVSGAPCDRMEVVAGVPARTFSVPLVRDAADACVGALDAVLPDGTTNRAAVAWRDGETEKSVAVPLPANLPADCVVPLSLVGEDGEVAATNFIAVVAAPENTPKNPLWFGERNAATLRAGEWTMDRDLVLAKAAQGGSALTLIGGSLWCPDCVNTDAYLVDTDAFKNWAAANGVYCAAVDVPIFASGLAAPTLLSYESFDVSWLGGVTSGAGYLSRKAAPLTGNGGTNAAAILSRNLNLATNTLANGGLCRPECEDSANADTGKWKTGVPCFVMQNADGEIKGRLYQFSNVSPTNADTAAAYVQRLEELRELAGDPTEELNRHWSTATTKDCEIALRGGAVESTISAIDTSDFWRIAGRGRWLRASFALKTDDEMSDGGANVRLKLWRKEADAAEVVARAEGNLALGVALGNLEISADESVEYFVQVEAIDSSAAFALDRSGDSVVGYSLTAMATEYAGEIVLTKTEATASEADAKKAGGTLRVYVPLERTGGASGATNVAIAVDEDLTTAFADRYAVADDSVSWADGELGIKSCAVDVFDDANADGTQIVVLRCGDAAYTLTITDNDKANVGKLSLVGVAPATAKAGTVIAEEGTTVTLGVSRVNGADGDVCCTLKTTAGEFEDEPSLAWKSRESGAREIALRLPTLADCKAGKAVVSFASLSGIAADSSAKKLTIQMVAQDAPRFAVVEKSLSLARYCACSQDVAVVGVADGAKAKVAKLSGSLPAGVSAKLVGDRLTITGTPTRAGTYEAVYQVSQTAGRKTTAGLTVRLAFGVVDVATLDPSAPGANPSVAKSRTFGVAPVVDATARRLTGIVSGLTIPPTGKCSAKYKCAAGTIALSSSGWSAYDAESGDLTAKLVVARKEYSLEVCARADGTVEIALCDPDFTEGLLAAEISEGWSASDSAADWKGYYVAAFDNREGEALANGNPTMTMKMTTASAANKGLMTYAGTLPNGQSFSGSAVLLRDGDGLARLPTFVQTRSEFFTAAPQIKSGSPAKAVGNGDDAPVLPWWTHAESVAAACSDVCYLRTCGSVYDSGVDLLVTVSETANGHELVAVTNGQDVVAVPLTISSSKVTLDAAAAKAAGAKLTFTKSTGIVSGSFKVKNSAGKSVTANFKGVVLPDWGDGCPNCGDVPWATGAFWFQESMPYEKSGRMRSLSVKVGDAMYVESY